MRVEEVRYMYLFVFFDLPVKTKTERRNATRFRNFLKTDGYDMLQLSVYSRVCRGQDAVDKHLARVRSHLPPAGGVRALQVTELQWGRMQILVGARQRHEKIAKEQL